MITHEVSAVKEFCEELWRKHSEKHYLSTPDSIEVSGEMSSYVRIRVASMYSAPGLNFALLSDLSEFFGTRNINDDDRFGHGGCDTCDYGSSYGLELSVRPDE